MTPMTTLSGPSARTPLRISLWTAQTILFVLFTLFGGMKLLMPVDRLAQMWIWPGQVPAWFLHLTGVLDIAGGIGVLLPALSGIQPRLTVLAALGCTLLQIAAIIFHLSRGEASVVPLNFVLLALSAFVLWGRGRHAPIASP
jgi:DoxX-like family